MDNNSWDMHCSRMEDKQWSSSCDNILGFMDSKAVAWDLNFKNQKSSMDEGKIEIAVILILIAIIIMLGIVVWQNNQIINLFKGVNVYRCLKDLPLP